MKCYSLLFLALMGACGDQLEVDEAIPRTRPVRAPAETTTAPVPVPAPPSSDVTLTVPTEIEYLSVYGGAVGATISLAEALEAPRGDTIIVVHLRSAMQGEPSPRLVAWANQHGFVIEVDCRKPLPTSLERVACVSSAAEPQQAMRAQMAAAPELYVVATAGTKEDLAFLNSLPRLRGVSLVEPALSNELAMLVNRMDLAAVVVEFTPTNARALARILAAMPQARALRGVSLVMPTMAVDVRMGRWLANLPQLQSLYLEAKRVNPEALMPLAHHATLRSVWAEAPLDSATVKTLAKLPALTSLLFDCADELDVAGLAAARKLERLLMKACTLRDLTPLATLPALAKLDIIDGETTDGAVAGLVRAPQLSALSLFNPSGVTGASLASVAQLSTLDSLMFYGVPVTAAQLEPLRAHPTLREISLGRSGLTDAGLEVLATLPQLRALSLGDTEVTDAGLLVLRAYASTLEQFEMASLALTEASLDTLRQLTNLRQLTISGGWLTNANLERLLPLQQLTMMTLTGGKLNSASIPTFLKFAALRYAFVWGNEYTEAEEKRLEATLNERRL